MFQEIAAEPTTRGNAVFQQFELSGNNPGILSEFEVALKSILLNAPPKHDSFVNILADNTVFTALDDIYNKMELEKWVTRNQIKVHLYHGLHLYAIQWCAYHLHGFDH